MILFESSVHLSCCCSCCGVGCIVVAVKDFGLRHSTKRTNDNDIKEGEGLGG